eukprot:scaffold1156_cov394-Prasinococcus_capsulatus_cf.AAC.19
MRWVASIALAREQTRASSLIPHTFDGTGNRAPPRPAGAGRVWLGTRRRAGSAHLALTPSLRTPRSGTRRACRRRARPTHWY